MSKPRPQVISQPKTHQHLLLGINSITNLLAATYGPLCGSVAMGSNDNSKIEMLDDAGTTVRRIISLGSQKEDIGAMLMRSLIWRLEQRVGDGGALAAVLVRSIVNEGVRMISAGANAMRLATGVRAAVDAAVTAIRQQARPVSDENALAAVALTTTRERDLSAVVAEMRWLLGPEGHVSIERFVAPYLERRYIAGAQFKSKIVSMYFYTDPAKKRVVLAESLVAVVDGTLTSTADAVALLEAALQREAKSLLVIASDITGQALNVLVSNNQLPADKKKLEIAAFKLSAIGDERRWAIVDLAMLTGAQVLGGSAMRSAASARPSDLGQSQRAEFVNDALAVVTGGVNQEAVRAEASMLQSRLAKMPFDESDRIQLVRRLSTLTGGVGELKIGANSQPAREVLNAKAERALKVLSAAQRSGVVPGGGSALVHAIRALDNLPAADADVAMGIQVMRLALAAPLRQIAANAAAESPAGVAQRVAAAGSPFAFDAFTGQIVDAHAGGILDAADVIINVLQSAASGALMALTTDAIVYHRKPKQSLEP